MGLGVVARPTDDCKPEPAPLAITAGRAFSQAFGGPMPLNSGNIPDIILSILYDLRNILGRFLN